MDTHSILVRVKKVTARYRLASSMLFGCSRVRRNSVELTMALNATCGSSVRCPSEQQRQECTTSQQSWWHALPGSLQQRQQKCTAA